MAQHAPPHLTRFYLAQFELKSLHDMVFFDCCLTIPKETGLTIVIFKAWAPFSNFRAIDDLRVTHKTELGTDLLHNVTIKRGRGIGDAAFVHRRAHMRIAPVIGEGTDRPIDRNLVEVRTSQTA